MPVTDKVLIPEDSELTTQELELSWPILQACSFHLGKKCEWDRNEFMLCRQEERDPRRCLNEGKAVTACAINFFREMKKHCLEQANRHAYCIEHTTERLEFHKCRQTQAALDTCVLENMNIERPSFGYFCEAKIHDTSRPKPPPAHTYKTYPDAVPGLPEDAPKPPAKYGNRFIWQTN